MVGRIERTPQRSARGHNPSTAFSATARWPDYLAEGSLRLFASEVMPELKKVIPAAEQVSQADIGHHAEPAAFRLQA